MERSAFADAMGGGAARKQSQSALPPALLHFKTVAMHEAVCAEHAGLDALEAALAHAPDSDAARQALCARVASLCATLERAIEERCAEQQLIPRCEAVIMSCQRDFEPLYDACFGNVLATAADELQECTAAIGRLEDTVGGSVAVQRTSDIVELYAAGAKVRARASAAMARIAGASGATLAEPSAEARERLALKRVARIAEKVMLRPERAGQAERICDVVRDMFVHTSMRQMTATIDAFVGSDEVRVVRIKDRFSHPSAGGWRDVMVNYVLADDESAHVCEAQLVHKTLLHARADFDGHVYYGRVRNATELLEKCRMLEPSGRAAQVRDWSFHGRVTVFQTDIFTHSLTHSLTHSGARDGGGRRERGRGVADGRAARRYPRGWRVLAAGAAAGGRLK